MDNHWSEVESAGKNPTGYYKLTQLIERAIHKTCKRIKAIAEETPEFKGMATTLTLLLIVDGNAIVGHVGDSRLYLKRNKEVFQLTTDHTLFNEMVNAYETVDLDSIKKFAHCLTRSVGNNADVAVETLMFEARQHDVLLLCTDGLSNYFDDDTVVAGMLSGRNVNVIADSLVKFANDSGGSDNVTALVIRVVDVEDFSVNAHRIRLDLTEEKISQDTPSSS
ncbi:MAG: serine/threonine protein phosphatase PrpC [Mariniblastus sp.]